MILKPPSPNIGRRAMYKYHVTFTLQVGCVGKENDIAAMIRRMLIERDMSALAVQSVNVRRKGIHDRRTLHTLHLTSQQCDELEAALECYVDSLENCMKSVEGPHVKELQSAIELVNRLRAAIA